MLYPPSLRWFHELLVHRPHRLKILIGYGVDRAPALFDIPLETADKADVGICGDKNLDIQKLAYRRDGQDEDALEENDGLRESLFSFSGSNVAGEIVDPREGVSS